MRTRDKWLAAASLAGLGIGVFVSQGDADAGSGKSTVSSIVEAADTANDRGVLFVFGAKLTSFKGIVLLTAQDADAGGVEVISQTSTGITIGLPQGLAPGSYKLRLSPKRGDPCVVTFTFRKTYALFGTSNDSNDNATIPVIASNSAESGRGVMGDSTAATGNGVGVSGSTAAPDGIGVLGSAYGGGSGGVFVASAPGGYGVRGVVQSPATGGVAVYADAVADGSNGVQVLTRGDNATAWLSAQDGTGGTIARYLVGGAERIRFELNGHGRFNGGIHADSPDADGVRGVSNLAGKYGVFGIATNTSGFSAGVRGSCDSTFGAGVLGVANGNGCAGLWGDVGASISGDPAVFAKGGVAVARIDGSGKGIFNGGTQTGGADFAESVTVNAPRSEFEPGDVLVIDVSGVRRFALSRVADSPLVAGIYSTKPGVLACPGEVAAADAKWAETDVPLAITGIVPCKVCDEGGAIRAGDLLVAASIAGHAKKAPENPKPGTLVGKALGRLDGKRGKVEVLITMR